MPALIGLHHIYAAYKGVTYNISLQVAGLGVRFELKST